MHDTRAASLVLLLAAACNGPPGGGSADGGFGAGECPALEASIPEQDGPFSAPGDFDRESCAPASFSGFDPTGLWYVHPAEERRFGAGTGPIRFAFDCEAGLEAERGNVFAGGGEETVALTRDDLFARAAFQFGDQTYTLAWDFCRREDDALYGHAVTCFRQGEEEEDCFGAEVKATRFGHIPGESTSEGLEEVARFTGDAGSPWPPAFTSHVEIDGDIAYVARARDGLRIVDVSDPTAPAELGHLPIEEGFFNDLARVQGPGGTPYLLIADDSGALSVDVSDPTSPQLVTTFGESVHRFDVVTAEGKTWVYLIDGYSIEMPIYDATDPTNPTFAGNFTGPNPEWGFHAVHVKDGRAYVSATGAGLLVVDVEDPASPSLLGQFGEGGVRFSHHSGVTTIGERTIAVHGDEGYGAHIEIVDVDPASDTFMERIGEFQTRAEVSVHNIQVQGSRAYVAWYQDGVRILDLSDPTSPAQIAYYNTWSPETSLVETFEGAVDLDLDPESGLLYVADTPGGLIILEETDPL